MEKEFTQEEEARFIEAYNKRYTKNLEKREKMLKKAHGGLTVDDQWKLLDLERKRYDDYQVVPSVREYIRQVRLAQRKEYERKLDKWDPKSGKPKPKMPKQDSFIRYAEAMANHDTRTISTRQANAILKEKGVFKVKRETINKSTGEVKTRETNITRDELYYLGEDDLEDLIWSNIRARRKELIEENKKKGGDALWGHLLSDYLATTIAQEFFGSD